MGKAQEIPDRYAANWLDQLDRRTGLAQEIHRRYKALTDDLGGADRLSYQKRALVSRALFVELSLQQQEAALAAGGEVDSGSYTQQVNSLIGLLKTLGLDRAAKDTPDLASFLKAKAGASQ